MIKIVNGLARNFFFFCPITKDFVLDEWNLWKAVTLFFITNNFGGKLMHRMGYFLTIRMKLSANFAFFKQRIDFFSVDLSKYVVMNQQFQVSIYIYCSKNSVVTKTKKKLFQITSAI